MSAIFQTFMKEFGEGMTVKSLDSVIKGLSKVSEVRDVQDFFELIQSVNTNAVLIENHFADIKPHIDGNREEFEACLRSKTNLLHLLEDKIAAGLDKVLTAQIAHVKRLLKKNQTSSDFYPSSRGPVSFQATPACISVCKYVKDQHNLVSRCLDGANVEIFLHEFGSRMLLLILRRMSLFVRPQLLSLTYSLRLSYRYQEMDDRNAVWCPDFNQRSHRVSRFSCGVRNR
jgi:hypothetical protein